MSAIEHGHRVPSVAMLDTITRGLGINYGSMDLELLASAPTAIQRHILIHRLQGGRATNLDIQRALRISRRYTDFLNEPADIQYALAEVAIDRGAWRRAQIRLENMLGKTSRVAVSTGL